MQPPSRLAKRASARDFSLPPSTVLSVLSADLAGRGGSSRRPAPREVAPIPAPTRPPCGVHGLMRKTAAAPVYRPRKTSPGLSPLPSSRVVGPNRTWRWLCCGTRGLLQAERPLREASSVRASSRSHTIVQPKLHEAGDHPRRTQDTTR